MKALYELAVTMDTREKSARRKAVIRQYFESKGAFVYEQALRTCDYRIEGMYDGKYVCVGIEFKTGSDFAGSFDILNDRLARACLEYNGCVGLILQHNHSKFMEDQNESPTYHYIVDNVTTLFCNYSTLHNTLRSYERDGIMTEEVYTYNEIPYAMVGFLNYITKHGAHVGARFGNTMDPRNVIMRIPGIGIYRANKLIDRFQTIEAIAKAHVHELQATIGPIYGQYIYDYVRGIYG